jgi:hypothetical protein
MKNTIKYYKEWLQMLQVNKEEDQEQKWQIQKQIDKVGKPQSRTSVGCVSVWRLLRGRNNNIVAECSCI